MAYVHCDVCGAGFHSNVRGCPDCGATAKRVHERRTRFSRTSSHVVREDVELEVRDALYGRRTGAVERLSGV
jgi:predicted  nucleic acid-binding Zn-ribbon protein